MLPIVNWALRAWDTSSTPTEARAVGVRTTTTGRDAFIAVFATAGNGIAQRSATGDSWLDTGSGLTGELRDVSWMGGSVNKWLIAADGGVIWHRGGDVDTAWTAVGPGSGDDFYCIGANDDGTLAVAAGENGRLYTSTDGTTWTSRTTNTASDLLDVAFGSGRWVVVGNSPGTDGFVLTSTDGTTWTEIAVGNGQVPAVVYDAHHEVFVLADGTNVYQVTAAGAFVSPAVGTLPASGLTSLVSDGAGTIIAMLGKRISISVDAGETWSAPTPIARVTNVNAVYVDVVWSETLGCYLAVGTGPSIAQSLRTS